MEFFEVSSKTGDNVDEMFRTIAREINSQQKSLEKKLK
jgi:GTPase SAR1 family protein